MLLGYRAGCALQGWWGLDANDPFNEGYDGDWFDLAALAQRG